MLLLIIRYPPRWTSLCRLAMSETPKEGGQQVGLGVCRLAGLLGGKSFQLTGSLPLRRGGSLQKKGLREGPGWGRSSLWSAWQGVNNQTPAHPLLWTSVCAQAPGAYDCFPHHSPPHGLLTGAESAAAAGRQFSLRNLSGALIWAGLQEECAHLLLRALPGAGLPSYTARHQRGCSRLPGPAGP